MNEEDRAELERIGREMQPPPGGGAKALAALDPRELCDWYRPNKRWIVLAIDILEKIPFVPKVIIEALRALIIIADRLCPA